MGSQSQRSDATVSIAHKSKLLVFPFSTPVILPCIISYVTRVFKKRSYAIMCRDAGPGAGLEAPRFTAGNMLYRVYTRTAFPYSLLTPSKKACILIPCNLLLALASRSAESTDIEIDLHVCLSLSYKVPENNLYFLLPRILIFS